VLVDDAATREARLALALATRQVLKTDFPCWVFRNQ
jgi:arginyl-tRNA synthetase